MFCPDFCAAGAGDRGDGLNVKNAEPSTTLDGSAFCMKYCLRNMKLLRNEVSFGYEVKFAPCAQAHFIAKLLHTPSGVLHLP